MAETVIIDIETRYRDKASKEVQDTAAEIDRLRRKLTESETAARKTGDSLKGIRPAGIKGTTEDLDRLWRKLTKSEAAARKADSSLERMAATAGALSKKTIRIPVKVLDYATKPLRSLLHYATSLKGILAGLVVGKAGQLLVGGPLGLADQYSNSYIGFQTLFRSDRRAQKMMDDLDEFARTTPYKTANVIGQSQKMLAMGWDADRLIQDMRIIGDAAAATGKGDEGLERIVLSLAQIKSKGKLSTEELNQLAETGINAKAYVAQGLGYGTSDAAQQKLAKALQSGQIGGNAAVEMILAGMQRDYAGMMQTLSKETAAGMMSNIQDTVEIHLFRKWGQGLQAGAKVGLGSLADLLDQNPQRLSAVGDELERLGAHLSTKLAGYAEAGLGKAMDLIESADFQHAALAEKGQMFWDALLAQPLRTWWEQDGRAMLGSLSGKIGEGVGRFYGGAITTLLGIQADGVLEEGASVGARFAEGLIQGFDAKKVGEAVKNSFSNALKLLPGGEEATSTSWLSAALLGYGGIKLAGGAKGLLGGLGGLGTAGARALLGSETLGRLAIDLGAGNLSKTASLGVGVLSAVGATSVAGGAAGGAGLISALADLTKALNTANSAKERNVAGWSAASKAGMVGTGAAVGAGIGSLFGAIGAVPGALIGAGAGGLGALLGGGKAGRAISDLLDGTGKIKAAAHAIRGTGDALAETIRRSAELDKLAGKYKDLSTKLQDGSLKAADLTQAQGELSRTIQDLQSLYPGLITQYDIENGKLGEKLELLHKIAEAEKDKARREAAKANAEADKQLPSLQKKLQATQGKRDAAMERYGSLLEEAQLLSSMEAGYREQERLKAALGETSKEYRSIQQENALRLKDYNARYGQGMQSGIDVSIQHDRVTAEAEQARIKAENEGQAFADLLTQYQQIYQGKLAAALDPASLDAAGGLDAVVQKVAQLQAAQQQRLELEKQLAKVEKGSEAYDAAASAIQEAEKRQQELTASLEPFKGQLAEVLRAVQAIQEQFVLLGGMRFDLDEMGLTGVFRYAMPYQQGSVKDQAYWEQVAAHYAKTGQDQRVGGYAKGTLSAPPGLAWVGENGPELVRMRGGEQVYTASESLRIAQHTASRPAPGRGAAGGIQVDLGGMSIHIQANGSGGDIVEQIRARLPEIGNELCTMIAAQLARTYANMPTNAVEGIG